MKMKTQLQKNDKETKIGITFVAGAAAAVVEGNDDREGKFC